MHWGIPVTKTWSVIWSKGVTYPFWAGEVKNGRGIYFVFFLWKKTVSHFENNIKDSLIPTEILQLGFA